MALYPSIMRRKSSGAKCREIAKNSILLQIREEKYLSFFASVSYLVLTLPYIMIESLSLINPIVLLGINKGDIRFGTNDHYWIVMRNTARVCHAARPILPDGWIS